MVAAQPASAAWLASVRANGLVVGSVERTRDRLDRALKALDSLWVLTEAGMDPPRVSGRDEAMAADD